MPKSAHTYKRHQESPHGKRDLASKSVRGNSHPFSYFSWVGYGIFLIQVHKCVRGGKNPTSGPITFAIGALNHLPTSRLFLSKCHSNLNLLTFLNTVFDRTPTFNKSWWRGMSLYSWHKSRKHKKTWSSFENFRYKWCGPLKTLPISFPSRVEFCLSCSLLNP